MRHCYTEQGLSPPALFVSVILKFHGSPYVAGPIDAKIDTAADITAVPRQLAERRGVISFGDRFVRQTGRTQTTHLVELEINGKIYFLEALAHDIPYVLIGRDILNQCTLIADGPNEAFELIQS